MPSRAAARFIEPMRLLRTDRLPDDRARWCYQIKVDGYRAVAFNAQGSLSLRSRNDNDFSLRYAPVMTGLAALPPATVVDGEIVALDEHGRPSFNALQNAAGSSRLVYYVFDVMILRGRNVMGEPLVVRHQLLDERVLPRLAEPVRPLGSLDAPLPDLIHAVKAQGLEGLVAKRLDSHYEPGLRSGTWQKMRLNQGQEFVIGGYTLGTATFDALIFGYYEGHRLLYAARTRNGFTPAVRAQLFKAFRALEQHDCPFANLPEARSGRWGQGLTKEKMKDCIWLKPVLVGQFEFLEWTPDNHLRHTRFVGLRPDRSPTDVTKEH